MRKIDRILLAVVFVVLFGRFAEQLLNSDGEGVRTRPRAKPPISRPPQADGQPGLRPNLADSYIQPSSVTPNSRYTGTAFSVSRDGYWVTANHVTEGCKRVDILKETGLRSVRRVAVQGWRAIENMDVSVMDSGQGEAGLTLATNLVQEGDLGFFFGYPQGVASAGYAVNLGRSRMVRQRGRVVEPSDEWAVYEMLPGRKIALGGNSGGPIMNAAGEVVGVVSAGSDRRGRMNTSIVVDLDPLQPFSRPEYRVSSPLTVQNYAAVGEKLRRSGLVTKVDCRT